MDISSSVELTIQLLLGSIKSTSVQPAKKLTENETVSKIDAGRSVGSN